MATDHLASHEARSSFLQALEDTAIMNSAHAYPAGQVTLHDVLPAELLPEILRHLRYRQGELARTSLVCKQWYAVSKPVSRMSLQPTFAVVIWLTVVSSLILCRSRLYWRRMFGDKKLLWEWVRAPRDSERIVRAFSALAANPELCSYVKELEVRVYPLASQHRLDALQEEALEIFKHASNLETLVRALIQFPDSRLTVLTQ